MKTILIAENNKDFAYVIHWFFTGKGYRVHTSPTGEEALRLHASVAPDVILLDIGLDGEIDGKEVARRVRVRDRQTPVIFMSGESNSPADVVDGFQIGCDFFLKKPVSLEEIEAHVLAALKEGPARPGSAYRLGKLRFDARERLLSGQDVSETLTGKETDVLRMLAEHEGTTVETTDLLLHAWGTDDKEESLRNCISTLRKKTDGQGIIIETIKGRGYRLKTDS
jgi:DNA-binding response OmpR family regulator